jgi:hypothetical protein
MRADFHSTLVKLTTVRTVSVGKRGGLAETREKGAEGRERGGGNRGGKEREKTYLSLFRSIKPGIMAWA